VIAGNAAVVARCGHGILNGVDAGRGTAPRGQLAPSAASRTRRRPSLHAPALVRGRRRRPAPPRAPGATHVTLEHPCAETPSPTRRNAGPRCSPAIANA